MSTASTRKQDNAFALLRKLRSFNTSQHTLSMVYKSLTESVLTFNIVSWYGNLSVKQKKKTDSGHQSGQKINGVKQLQPQDLFSQSITKKAIQIHSDPTHPPLHSAFQLLASGCKLKVQMARRNVYKKSFIPSAVTILNKSLFKSAPWTIGNKVV